MKIKKCNGALSLILSVLALIHIGYSAWAYLTFYYNPTLKNLTAIPFILLTCIHAVISMSLVFTQGDGTRLDLYPKHNARTILQRVSAALIFPMLILHLKTFEMLQATAKGGLWVPFALLILFQILFYGVVLIHVAFSVSKALITIGLLQSRKRQILLDRIVLILCAAVFVLAVFAVTRGELAMFGGAA